MSVKKFAALVSVAVLCAFVFAASAAGEYENPTMAPLEPGEVLMSLSLPGLDGEEYDISRSTRRGPVGIFFWSVFCSSCKEAMPELIRIQNEWGQKGLTIWAVNVDGQRFSNAVEDFVKSCDFPLPVVYDVLDGELLRAADPLGVDKTPTLYLADLEGRVVQRQVARIKIKEVEKALGELLD